MNFQSLATISIVLLASCAVNQGTHDYSATNPRALRDYNAGWSYIMDAGRWTESEEAFRAAHEAEPDWIMGAALVARITQDVEEREQLLEQIEAGYDGVDPDTRLLLDVFIMSIRAANARDRGTKLPDGFADERMAIALRNFAEFVRRHPGETYSHAERLEVIHHAEGADAALAMIEREVPADVRRAPFFASFAAGLEAERGNHERAAELAAVYRDRLNDPDAPGIDALESVLLQHRGDLRGALEAAERAASKDPKHLIAVRRCDWLRSQLD